MSAESESRSQLSAVDGADVTTIKLRDRTGGSTILLEGRADAMP
ncbi:hypothetical protein [Bradyrhizobium sp. Ghvi]|nr:hypothetical protein [Bradyrhizobium sp. Ghvi]